MAMVHAERKGVTRGSGIFIISKRNRGANLKTNKH